MCTYHISSKNLAQINLCSCFAEYLERNFNIQPCACMHSVYLIAGNLHGVLIFVLFVTAVAVMKFCIPRKFVAVGKGCQTKSLRDRDCSISGIFNLLTVSLTIEHRIKLPKLEISLFLSLW